VNLTIFWNFPIVLYTGSLDIHEILSLKHIYIPQIGRVYGLQCAFARPIVVVRFRSHFRQLIQQKFVACHSTEKKINLMWRGKRVDSNPGPLARQKICLRTSFAQNVWIEMRFSCLHVKVMSIWVDYFFQSVGIAVWTHKKAKLDKMRQAYPHSCAHAAQLVADVCKLTVLGSSPGVSKFTRQSMHFLGEFAPHNS